LLVYSGANLNAKDIMGMTPEESVLVGNDPLMLTMLSILQN